MAYGSHWSPMVSQTSNGANDMSEMINLVPPAAKGTEEHARADTQRNKQLFDNRLEALLGRRFNSMKLSDDAFTSYSRLE